MVSNSKQVLVGDVWTEVEVDELEDEVVNERERKKHDNWEEQRSKDILLPPPLAGKPDYQESTFAFEISPDRHAVIFATYHTVSRMDCVSLLFFFGDKCGMGKQMLNFFFCMCVCVLAI